MDTIVYCKILEQPFDKNNNQYTKVIDQYGEAWNIFRSNIKFEVGKYYLFTYTRNDKGYPEYESIRELTNVFEQQALSKVANINDIKKDLSVAMAYVKDLIIADKVELSDWFKKSDEVYEYMITKAQSLMPKSPEFNFEKDK